MSTNFYVYEHWRPDTGVCFYVGKGKDKRAWVMSARNREHRGIQSLLTSLGFSIDVRIVIRNVSEDTAFAVERDRVAFHGLHTLCNMTEGGEGNSGAIFSPEHRQKISDGLRGRKQSPEHLAKLSAIRKGRLHTPEAKAKMSLLRRGSKLSLAHCAAISLGQKGKVIPLDARLKMSKAHKGKTLSVEHRAKLSAVALGRPLAPEQRAKIAAANRRRAEAIRAAKDVA